MQLWSGIGHLPDSSAFCRSGPVSPSFFAASSSKNPCGLTRPNQKFRVHLKHGCIVRKKFGGVEGSMKFRPTVKPAVTNDDRLFAFKRHAGCAPTWSLVLDNIVSLRPMLSASTKRRRVIVFGIWYKSNHFDGDLGSILSGRTSAHQPNLDIHRTRAELP